MTAAKFNLGLILVSLACLSACASPGIPQPPSLEFAQPVTDLHAVRKGDTVTLTWTAPTKTTEGRNMRHLGTTEVCRSIESDHPCATVIARTAHRTGTSSQQVDTDQLDAKVINPSSQFFYSVRVVNSHGKSAGPSNLAQVPAAPSIPAPSDFAAKVSADGVIASWQAVTTPEILSGMRFFYRIYRRDEGSSSPEIAGEVPMGQQSFVDHEFVWEHTYEYFLTVVTAVTTPNGAEQTVEGVDTPVVTVVAHDVFPPTVPSGLQAVFSGPGQKVFVDLVWSGVTDADLAGYNIYRHEQGTPLQKINPDLVKSPAFRDDGVVPGHDYIYSVSAVDLRGNESARSEEANEKVPAE